jgi:hypothetical protein
MSEQGLLVEAALLSVELRPTRGVPLSPVGRAAPDAAASITPVNHPGSEDSSLEGGRAGRSGCARRGGQSPPYVA